MTSNELRRRILQVLYDLHRENGSGTLSAAKLQAASGTDDEKQFWEDVRFLHDEGYLNGTPVPFEREGYIERALITPKGISLMGDPTELDSIFPVDSVHLVVDDFLGRMRLEFELADMDDDEKEQFFMYLEKFSCDPKASAILYNVLNTCFRRKS